MNGFMSFLSGIPFWIIAILMLGLLILVHESGHYLVGRLFKFGIDEFSIGMGPKLFSKKHKGIRYSLRAIPMGGFVAFHGEDAESSDPTAMNNQPWYKRAPVVFAGAGFNILFSLLLTAILACAFGCNLPQITEVREGAPVEAQLQAGDVVTAVNGKKLLSTDQFSECMAQVEADEPIRLTVLRDGKKVNMDVRRQYSEVDGKYMLGITFGVGNVKINPIEAVGFSVRYNIWMTKVTYQSLWQLITGKLGIDSVSGPISTIGMIGGIVQDVAEYDEITVAERAREIVALIMDLLVIISMNLAIMNLLPFPALDGFRLVTTLVEGITHRHLPRRAEGIINSIGLTILLGGMLVLELSKLFMGLSG